MSKPTEVTLSPAVRLAIGAAAGIIINWVLSAMHFIAMLIEITNRLLGRPDKGVPLPTTARVASIPGARGAAPVIVAQIDSDDDAAAEIVSGPGSPVAAPAAAPAPAGGAVVAAAAAAAAAAEKLLPPVVPGVVDVVHIPVDADKGTKSDAWRLVGPYLRHYGGGALSSSTLWNPEFIHMFVPGAGSQPYVVGRAYCRTIVIGIGDPLSHPGHWPEMAAAFRRAFPHATYAHVGPEFAAILKTQCGFAINDMGAETNILVQQWAYNKKTRTIRMAARDARAAGVAVRELTMADLSPEVCRQLAQVTGDWVQQKSVKDQMLRVFIRHAEYDNLQLEEGVRLFVAERPLPAAAPAAGDDDASSTSSGAGGPRRVEGFVLVDPLWRGGAVYGYVTSLNRMRRDTHHGTLKLLYEEIMAVTKKEGKEMMTFGFSPFFNIQKEPFCGPVWAEMSTRFMFHFGNNLYQFKNLAFSKARYGGGVEGDAYKDPNVTMTHVYGVTHAQTISMNMLDQYVLLMYVGFLGDLFDTLLKLAGFRASMGNSFSDDCASLARGASLASLPSLAGKED
ncbi:MAG: hypothetical protein J3K34DRAFT_517039 [Monoraphidium minutum]|nr:MAG: hypothetical protein J3K34DRAFT_517039 [Monoraphidium minutum]